MEQTMKKYLILTLFMINSAVCHATAYVIDITDPAPNQTFHDDAESITVSVSVKPALQANDKIVILVDGQPNGDPTNATSFSLPTLERGSHTLQAEIVSADGGTTDSDEITIFQQKHSVLLGPGPFPKTQVNQMTVYRAT
jgi:hypothetical protein